ncbi:transcriptional regulator family: Zinc finger, BED-type predicted [Penicillium roqueforti]|nr:transcriptional regulator family: Zinc finger, BED-type predicted [Penicillium roqueforti]KAI3184709.1 transcriptional regulator family: Zinc finger, BED-type predicted [Penicillium roqueforti]
MSGAELQASNNDGSGSSSVELPPRPQRSQRIDYHFLNGGSDEDDIEDHIRKKPRLDSPPGRLESIGPEDSASQLHLNLPTPSESVPPGGSRCFAEAIRPHRPHSKSRIKPLNQWLWNQFRVSPLPGKQWRPRRSRQLLEDREIQCIHCGWKTTDSARATSTTNMKTHLAKHNIFEKSDPEDLGEGSSETKQHSIASMFQSRAEHDTRALLEQNILRWVVTDDVAFTAIESPAFQQIFKDLPDARTVVRRIDADFDRCRIQLIDELARTCSTIALSLDVWTSKNHKAILGVIGHWVSTDFKYQERVLEFSELAGSHSGENMAETPMSNTHRSHHWSNQCQILIRTTSGKVWRLVSCRSCNHK